MTETKDYIDMFIAARDYLTESIEPMFDIYLSGIWDSLIETIIIKELNKMIDKDLADAFPNLPEYMRPRYTYRLFDDDASEIELSIQHYMNKEKGLSFLGNYNQMDLPYDLYCTPYYDGMNDFLFYARYGHIPENHMTGSANARSEYHLGMMTPLSVAYGMAVHDGYINE
jgi:hypothetical protein